MDGHSCYLMLGRGDYILSSTPVDQIDPDWRRPDYVSCDPADWSYTWDLAAWQQKIDFLADLGAKRFIFMLSAFELPYPSQAFPELVEPDHENVRSEFFQELLDYMAERGLTAIAGLSTTGHCDRAVQLHPSWAGRHSNGEPWQCGMCHNQPGAINYVKTVAREILTRYSGFGAVFLHPPEVGEFCYCDECAKRYEKDTGSPLAAADERAGLTWFWQGNLRLMREVADLAHELLPKAPVYLCTIPGSWEGIFPALVDHLPAGVTLLHWDYGKNTRETAERIERHLELYGAKHKLAFITSATYAVTRDMEATLEADTRAKLRLVRSKGIDDLGCFIGPVWFPERIRRASLAFSDE